MEPASWLTVTVSSALTPSSPPLMVVLPLLSTDTLPLSLSALLLYRAAEASCFTELISTWLLVFPMAEIRSALAPLVVMFTALLKKLELSRLVEE